MSTVTKTLEPDQIRDFAWGDLEGYTVVFEETDKNEAYKDYAPATTVAVDANGDYWLLNWRNYISHYGSGDHEYPDNFITLVTKVETTKTIVETNWVPIHEQ